MKNKKNVNILGLATMEALLKKNGAERVSEDAKIILREILEDYASTICKNAIRFSFHAGRKTVREEDIKLSFKEPFIKN